MDPAAPVQFIELPAFTRRITRLLSDEEYRTLQEALAKRPDAGALIRGGAGLRKVRWGAGSGGKRGGVRVIYYWHVAPGVVYMLDVYGKNERSDLSRQQVRVLASLIERLKG